MNVKVCFVALTAYPMLSGENLGHMIGPDVHTVLLGRELLKSKFDVTFITYDEGGPPVEHIDGIKVIKTYRREDVPRLNSALKALRIWKAMRKAKAHIYFHRGGASGVVPPFCWLMNKKSVWHIASNAYVDKGLKEFNLLGKFGAWLDMRLANVIIAQSEFQRAMLKKYFARDSVLIRSHFPLTRQGMPEKAKPSIILWVGAMAEVKQPELFLRLAEAMPELSFQMIGGVGGDRILYDRIRENAQKIPNLKLLGVIPFSEINHYFEQASILVNTSRFEGFPNAFMQSWMSYTPVISLNSDPDEIICQHRLGFHSKSFNQLVEDVKTLLGNEQLRRQMGENTRRYVEENHDINKIVKQHIGVFNRLIKSKRGG